MALVRQLRDAHDLTVVLVEHHMGLVMRLCDNITVLNFGRTIADGHARNRPQRPSRHRRIPGGKRVTERTFDAGCRR